MQQAPGQKMVEFGRFFGRISFLTQTQVVKTCQYTLLPSPYHAYSCPACSHLPSRQVRFVLTAPPSAQLIPLVVRISPQEMWPREGDQGEDGQWNNSKQYSVRYILLEESVTT